LLLFFVSILSPPLPPLAPSLPSSLSPPLPLLLPQFLSSSSFCGSPSSPSVLSLSVVNAGSELDRSEFAFPSNICSEAKKVESCHWK
jgi:hypothetical protein